MGLFSPKRLCNVCGTSCKRNKNRITGKGWICNKCFKSEIKALNITKKFGSTIKFDETNRKWFVPDRLFSSVKQSSIYSFDDIISFELLEDGNSITSGGTSRAIAGGVLFGGVGAVVAGVTSKRKTKNTCNKLQIKITVNDIENPAVYIDLI